MGLDEQWVKNQNIYTKQIAPVEDSEFYKEKYILKITQIGHPRVTGIILNQTTLMNPYMEKYVNQKAFWID